MLKMTIKTMDGKEVEGYSALVPETEKESELLNRDMPLEPIYLEGYNTWMCRACSGYIVDGSFCKHCGQRLKWRSDENR